MRNRSRARFEMERWQMADACPTDRCPPPTGGDCLCFGREASLLAAGCWLLAALLRDAGVRLPEQVGGRPPAQGQGPWFSCCSPGTRRTRRSVEPSSATGKCGSRPPPQPGSRIGTVCSHSVRGASLIRPGRPGCPMPSARVWCARPSAMVGDTTAARWRSRFLPRHTQTAVRTVL